MAQLQWGREQLLAETMTKGSRSCRNQCFNGAASSCSRKRKYVMQILLRDTQLQWGREQLLAETADALYIRAFLVVASMGPRAAARGNCVICGAKPKRIDGFNGAASSCSRKRGILADC